MTKPRQTVVIVGAGIGGLTAALAFARHGAEVFVLEQAAELKEVGAGLQITPNGLRVLEHLGLQDAIGAASIAADAVVPTDALTGQAITRFDLTAQSPRYRFFHRASLQGLIGRAAQAAGAQIYLGARATSVSQDGIVQTTNGPMRGDVVVGADGIHSITRTFCDPSASEAKFTGQVAWRGVVPMQNMPAQAQIWMAPHRHVVTYPLKDGLLNVVAIQERQTWAEEGWNHADDPENLRHAFADCAPALREVLAHLETPNLWGLFRHPVASRWTHGPVALLGDAAHPTLPFLAQGANMAIEDAFVLADCATKAPTIAEGFARYQALRRPRVVRAIETANANARNYHLTGMARGVAHLGLKTLAAVAPNAFLNRLGWLYDHDVTA